MENPPIPARPLADNPACNSICRVCHYKNLDYTTQLVRKQAWALEQFGSWKSALKEIIPAPEAERIAYRSKSWMWADVQDGEVSFGMRRSVCVRGKWEQEFVSWDTCPMHVESMQRLLKKLKQGLVKEAPGFVESSLVGIWVGTPHLVLVSRDEDSSEIRRIDWNKYLTPPFDRVWFHANSQVGRKIFGHREIELIAGPSVPDRVHPIRAFRQVARSLLVQARLQAVQVLLQFKPEMVVDLYCGTGELSTMLPPEVGWLGIELSSEAVKYANALRSSGIVLHTAYVGTVEHRLRDSSVLKQITEPYALYINPPRPGLGEGAGEALLALLRERPPAAIVYLSCSASSLARDLAALEKSGFTIEQLQPFDFFPQTEHFETLAILKKN